MGKLRIPRVNTSERMTVTPVLSEILYDENLRELFVGDGTTVGGIRVSLGHLRISDGTTTVNDVETLDFTGGVLTGSGTTATVTAGTATPNRGIFYAEDGTAFFGSALNRNAFGTVVLNTSGSFSTISDNLLQVINGGIYEIKCVGQAENGLIRNAIMINLVEIPDTVVMGGNFLTFDEGSSIRIVGDTETLFSGGIFQLNSGDLISTDSQKLQSNGTFQDIILSVKRLA